VKKNSNQDFNAEVTQDSNAEVTQDSNAEVTQDFNVEVIQEEHAGYDEQNHGIMADNSSVIYSNSHVEVPTSQIQIDDNPEYIDAITAPATLTAAQTSNIPDAAFPMQNGMIFPNTYPSEQSTLPWLKNTSLMYFNPTSYGYNNSSGGMDPREGYPLIYPYVPLPAPKREKPKKKGICC